MKDQKPGGPGEGPRVPSGPEQKNGVGEDRRNGTNEELRNALRSVTTGLRPPKPETQMNSNVQTRKKPGRLSRDTLNKLGEIFDSYFDDIRKEGVPDRFRRILDQFDNPKGKGSN